MPHRNPISETPSKDFDPLPETPLDVSQDSSLCDRQPEPPTVTLEVGLTPVPEPIPSLIAANTPKTVQVFSPKNAMPEDQIKMPLEFSDPKKQHRKDRFPRVGEECFGFKLWYSLGAGAFGKVFLGEQIGLANRPVVLKITDRVGDEPQVLAQLQHANIVPIYSVHENPAGLRAVCMPYFGGASLLSILSEVRLGQVRTESKNRFLEALDVVRSPSLAEIKKANKAGDEIPAKPIPESAEEPTSLRKKIRPLNSVQTAMWMIARLADGLHHAHDRGILHRDIKPANILIADDGQPMLLDFNLSRDADDPTSGSFGGTIAYMSPEALRAMLSRSTEDIRCVDHRSDLYSLSMVFFEILTGHIPSRSQGSYSMLPASIENLVQQRSERAPSLRESHPGMSWGLESVIRKSLDPQPTKRYQRAEHFAEDLRCLLEDRPLRHAPELSQFERLSKWRRRNPKIAIGTSIFLCLMGIVACSIILVDTSNRLDRANLELAIARSEERKHAYEDATSRVLMLVNVNTELQDPLRQGSQLCEETLGLYGVLDSDDWQNHLDWTRLTSEARLKLSEDTRELLQSLAWTRVKLSRADDKSTIREALRLLDKAEAIEGLPPSPSLWMDREMYLLMIHEPVQAAQAKERASHISPVSARDHYQFASSLLRSGDSKSKSEAISHLNISIRLNSRHYWAWFQRGVCHLTNGDELAAKNQIKLANEKYMLAAADFGACIGLWPEFSWGHFNLGCALDRGGQYEAALDAYASVLERDSDFVDARLNRGLIYLHFNQHQNARYEFNSALELRPEDSALLAGLAISLEGLGQQIAADVAFAKALEGLERVPQSTRIRIRLSYAFAVYQRHPNEAIDSFNGVLQLERTNADALYGLGMVMASQDKINRAIGYLSQCVDAAPLRKDASLSLAILQARANQTSEANTLITRWLEREASDSEVLYAAACVRALTAKNTVGTPLSAKAATEAIDYLKKSIKNGQSPDRASRDPDLASIIKRPEVSELLKAHQKN